MSELLEILFVLPLMKIYRAIFDLPVWFGTGGRVVIFSLVLNFLLSSVYRQMEARTQNARVKKDAMEREVQRMKSNFLGRERYFYVRATHRRYGYHPIQGLLGASELFLQIFIFFTVFKFLSMPGLLDGAYFGSIEDLGKPDGLLWGINFLPLLMTMVNVVSVIYYIPEHKLRIQAIGLGLLFLCLLYESPAGLVLYWTINNVWSLFRNMISKNRRKAVS